MIEIIAYKAGNIYLIKEQMLVKKKLFIASVILSYYYQNLFNWV